MKKILLLALIPLCMGCHERNKKGEELVRQYFLDSIYPNKQIYDIYISPLDSFYTSVYEDPSYLEIEEALIEYKDELEKEKSNYDYAKIIGGEKVIQTIIKGRQKLIRDNLKRMKELINTYKPKYVGFRCGFWAKYKTNYTDSLLAGYCILSPQTDKIIEILYGVNYPLDIDPADLLPSEDVSKYFVELEMDTTKMFWPHF